MLWRYKILLTCYRALRVWCHCCHDHSGHDSGKRQRKQLENVRLMSVLRYRRIDDVLDEFVVERMVDGQQKWVEERKRVLYCVSNKVHTSGLL